MSNPNQITVDIDTYLDDCPPWDIPINPVLIPELAAEIARRFDCTDIYGKIDELACLLLRERGIGPTA